MVASCRVLSGLITRQSKLMGMQARAMSDFSSYNSLNITVPSPFVYSVEMNRPKKMNALNKELWTEVGDFFSKAHHDPECRVVVISGAGRMFTSGIDLSDLSQLASIVYSEDDIARKSITMYTAIRQLQDLITEMEKCRKPVIGAVHNACVGAGVDMITAMDVRLCTKDAWFCVKEVDMGLAADVGTLQRLPKCIGSQSLVNELCLTARKMGSEEAMACGLVSKVYESKEELMEGALAMAATIASKSPVAVQGTKDNLVYSREHSTQEGLERIATYNMTMLQSEDLMKSAMAAMNRDSDEKPEFANF